MVGPKKGTSDKDAHSQNIKADIVKITQQYSYAKWKRKLDLNKYQKYTRSDTELITSPAFLSLTASAVKILLCFYHKRHLKYPKKNNRRTSEPRCTNCKEITMTYIELENEPFNFKSGTINRALKELKAKGFIRVVRQGGCFRQDKSVYEIIDKYLCWHPGLDFTEKKIDVKRGYQGQGLGAVKIKVTHKDGGIHTRSD